MTTCEVKFDNNPQGIYYSGQILSGVIVLNNNKPRKINALTLKIEGFAKCKWTESEGSGKSRRTVTYSGREDYIGTFSQLVASHEVTRTEFPQGLHNFNFSCQLPPQLPTSFESKYGYIRYQLKVEMERPWKFDIKYCFAFTVLKVLDLNYESPALRSPMKIEKSKNFFLGFGSNPLFISAEMPLGGFVSGQTIPVTIKANNESSVDIEETRVSLKKVIHYNSQTPRRKTRERVEIAAEVRHVGCPSKSKASIDVQLVVPPLAPTNVSFCRVLQVQYQVVVTAVVGGIHRNVLLHMPVVIGTIPFYGMNYNPGPSLVMTQHNMVPSTSSAPPLTPTFEGPGYPALPGGASGANDMPPPSYQQAMGMPSDGADEGEGLNDEKPFSPMYPVFNVGATNYQQSFNPPQISDPPPAYGFAPPQFSEKRPL